MIPLLSSNIYCQSLTDSDYCDYWRSHVKVKLLNLTVYFEAAIKTNFKFLPSYRNCLDYTNIKRNETSLILSAFSSMSITEFFYLESKTHIPREAVSYDQRYIFEISTTHFELRVVTPVVLVQRLKFLTTILNSHVFSRDRANSVCSTLSMFSTISIQRREKINVNSTALPLMSFLQYNL